MPKQNIVHRICLDVNVLLEKLDINFSSSISHAQSNCDVLQDLELEVSRVLIVLNFESDNILALFLRVKHIDCERQVLLIFASVPISESIQPGLSRHLIFALDDFLLVPSLLVKLWVHLEHQTLEVGVAELDLRGALFWVG